MHDRLQRSLLIKARRSLQADMVTEAAAAADVPGDSS
jgi:hypothetical protein